MSQAGQTKQSDAGLEVYRSMVPMAVASACVYLLAMASTGILFKRDLGAFILCGAGVLGTMVQVFAQVKWVKNDPTRENLVKAVLLTVANLCAFSLVSLAINHTPLDLIVLPVYALTVSMVAPTQKSLWQAVGIIAVTGAVFLFFTPPTLLVTMVSALSASLTMSMTAGVWRIKAVEEQTILRQRADQLAAELATALTRAQQKAENEAEANAQRGAYLANMSHELRTPLNGIIGVAGALKQLELTDKQREMADLIDSSGRTLERLVTDILDFAKIDAGKMDIEKITFDFAHEIDPLLGLMAQSARNKGIDLVVDRQDGVDGRFFGDPTRIKQVLTNITNNAIKFTTDGTVTIGLKFDEVKSRLTVSVADTGAGFDPEKAKTLFNRFEQADTSTNRTHGGTGLGLAIAKSLCELMGGDISAKSQVGVGSEFTFFVALPRAVALDVYRAEKAELLANKGPNPQAHEDAHLGQDERPLRILLAEDHPANRTVVQMILAPLEPELVMAEDGAEALDLFRQSHFDVILMDMQMPVMDGLGATRAIRMIEHKEKRVMTPIIMLTGNAMVQHKQAAKEAGANLHVAKPVSPQRLFEALEKAIAIADQASLATTDAQSAKSA